MKIMEAALFISSQPLTLDKLARIANINSLGHVKELVEQLQKEYESRGLEIFSTPDGYSMQVRPGLLPKVAHLTPYSDLGEGPKRTLALVTLKEPVKQSVIIKTQGNKAYSYIKDLKKRGLVVTEKEGHTKILKLTQEFERYFGEEKGKIKEQLERHIQAAGHGDEPGSDEKPSTVKPGEDRQDFIDEKHPVGHTQRGTSKHPEGHTQRGTSVIREDASREIPAEEKPEEKPPQDKKKPRDMKASHTHAFQEID